MNFTQLETNIKNFIEDDGTEFSTSIPEIIKQAENMIFARLPNLPCYRKTLTGNEFGTVDDRVFMFRLMATIKKILQDEFAKADPDYIVYAPTKQGMENAPETGRHKLYSAFIKKAIPGAQMFYNKKDDEIIYKLK